MTTILFEVIQEISGRRNRDQYNIARNDEQKEDTDKREVERDGLSDDKFQVEGNDKNKNHSGLEKTYKVHKTNRRYGNKLHRTTGNYMFIGRGQHKFIRRLLTFCLLTCLSNSLGEAAKPFDANGLDLLISYMSLRHGVRPWYGPDRIDCTHVPPLHLNLVIRHNHSRQSVDDEQAVSVIQDNDNVEISLRFLSGNPTDQPIRSHGSATEISGTTPSSISGCYSGREDSDQQIHSQTSHGHLVENTTVLEISDPTYTSGSDVVEINEDVSVNSSNVEEIDSSRLVDTGTSVPDVVAEISGLVDRFDLISIDLLKPPCPIVTGGCGFRNAESVVYNAGLWCKTEAGHHQVNGIIRKGEPSERENSGDERRNIQENPFFEEANVDVSLRTQRNLANNGGPSHDYEEELSSGDNKDNEDLSMALGPEVTIPRMRNLQDQQRTREGPIEATVAQVTSSDTRTLQYENDMVQRLIDEKDLVLEDGQDQGDQQKRERFRRTRKKTKQRGKKKNES